MENIDFLKLCNFHEVQTKALQTIFSTDATYYLYGGAAGGGKSYFLRWLAVYALLFLAQTYKLTGVRVGLFCEDYPSLKERHLSKVRFEFPEWLGTLNNSEHEFRLHPEFGSGVVAFRNLDDPVKYLSSEFAWVLVDEVSRDKEAEFHFLRSRMRWVDVEDRHTKFVAGSNPGGQAWVKRFWIDKRYDTEECGDLSEKDFVFISAKATDNPFLNAGYIKRLSTLPEQMRRAYMDGDWDIFDGQYFTEFRRADHVIEPFDPRDKDTWDWFKSLPSVGGFDYGYAAPACHLWGKRDTDGTWYIYKELYVRKHTYEALRDAICAEEVPSVMYADPAIWAKKDSPRSGFTTMVEDRRLTIKKAVNDRVIGWIHLKELLAQKKLKIFSNCRFLIETLPSLVYDEHNKEDLDTSGEDHAADALRYMVMTHKHLHPQNDILTYTKNQSMYTTTTVREELDDLFVEKPTSLFRPRYR